MARVEVGDQFILDIKRLGINGEGIGFYNNLAVFVKDAIPGEGVNVEIIEVMPNMAFAKVIEHKHTSDKRIEPSCPYYNDCGACQTMHIDYKQMCDYKRDILIETLRRYTSINLKSFEIKPTLGMENPFNYRNKNAVSVFKTDGKTSIAMIQDGSDKWLKVDSCLVLDEKLNEVNAKILECIDELGIPLYNVKYHRGVIRYLVTRIATATNEVQVCFVCLEKTPRIKELADKIMQIPEVASVYENFNEKRNGPIFGSETNHLAGKEFIVESIGRIKYNLTPTTFFQLNPQQTKVMYDYVKRVCKLSRKERVLDAYCGVGTIGLYLADMAAEVVGIEYNKASVEAARTNAALNKIKNASFFQGDAKELIGHMLEDKTFDVIILDPPRTGLQKELCEALTEYKIPRLVYVSCNPSTLAKDLEILKDVYKINSIQPIDMFPNTSAVESVCHLSLRNILSK